MMRKLRIFTAILVAAVVICACALADVVTTDNVNMRSGPSSDYRVICTIPKDTHVEYVDEKCRANGEVSWYQVKYEGKKGWIYAEYAKYDGVESVIASEYDLANIDSFLDVSVFFGQNLQTSAKYAKLDGLQEVLHDSVKKYFNDKLTFSGAENVDFIGLYGGEYTVFGVAPGMEISKAAMMLDAKGLALSSVEEKTISFDCATSAKGYDSILTMNVEDGTVVSIEFSKVDPA